jgi:hypothetical protein
LKRQFIWHLLLVLVLVVVVPEQLMVERVQTVVVLILETSKQPVEAEVLETG